MSNPKPNYQIWRKSIEIYSSYCPETEIRMHSVKNWQNLPISKHKADLHNINAYTKFCWNPLTFTKIIARKWKYGRVSGR